MTNEELQKIYVKADMKLDALKDNIHHLEQENKQLKDKIERLNKLLNCKERLTKIMPPDTEFIILSKSDYERQEKDIEEIALELRERIDKAIEYIKENACYEDDIKECNSDLVYSECTELLEILGDKE